MNYKIIINILGLLLILTGILISSASIFSVYYNENDLNATLISGSSTFLTGIILWIITRKSEKKDIGRREGYLIVTLSWILLSAFGSLPFLIHGSIPSFTDAFFETMSGFTTTGATIVKDIESMPHGLLYWRSLTQWLGGMGIIVLSLAVLPLLGVGGMQLYVAEVPGPTKDKIHPRVKETAKRLWAIYFILTAAEFTLLVIGGMDVFNALNHSFTTMATGGFSTKNSNIAYFASPFLQYVIIIFMFFAGINFSLHYRALHMNFSFIKNNDEFRIYTIFILVTTGVILLLHQPHVYRSTEAAFRESLFHVVSLVTTTGYVTSDYENWAPFSRMVFFILLFIGGCAGSTGGGIKFVRHILLFKNGFLELKRLIHPRAVIPVRINNKAISSEIISNVQAFFIFYIFMIILGSIIISILGVDFLSAAGATATCLGNVGPGIGTVGPVSTFSHLSDTVKWVLSFFMLLGRLELFTVLIIFSPAFWTR